MKVTCKKSAVCFSISDCKFEMNTYCTYSFFFRLLTSSDARMEAPPPMQSFGSSHFLLYVIAWEKERGRWGREGGKEGVSEWVETEKVLKMFHSFFFFENTLSPHLSLLFYLFFHRYSSILICCPFPFPPPSLPSSPTGSLRLGLAWNVRVRFFWHIWTFDKFDVSVFYFLISCFPILLTRVFGLRSVSFESSDALTLDVRYLLLLHFFFWSVGVGAWRGAVRFVCFR